MKEPMYAIAVLIGAAAIFMAIWVGHSAQEARSYNRVTGANVTTWDAMWLQLRVTHISGGDHER